jgi:SagB-type dehydrogenase family enzyme
MSASPSGTVELPTPRLASGLSLEQALAKRRSTREFRPDPVPLAQVSALLWAAFGVNRAGSWGRTAPSAHNRQAVTVYVVLPEGAYRYEPGEHRLQRVHADDLRALTGTQEFAATAPLNLVYVVDFESEEEVDEEEHGFLAGADVGCIAENVYLYCAAAGLATVVRGLIERRPLAQALGLRRSQRIALAQSIGYPRVAH